MSSRARSWLPAGAPVALLGATSPIGRALAAELARSGARLILAGRGSGKTRAGAEWIRLRVFGRWPEGAEPARRIALVGPTLGETRSVMVEGVSGLLTIHPDHERPTFEPSLKRLIWPNGAVTERSAAIKHGRPTCSRWITRGRLTFRTLERERDLP